MAVNRGQSNSKSQRQPRPDGKGNQPIQPFANADGAAREPARRVNRATPPSVGVPNRAAAPPARAIAPPAPLDPSAHPAPPRRVRSQQRGIARIVYALGRLFRACKKGLVRLICTWQFVIAGAFLTCVGAAGLAIAFIIQLPALPNCPAIFWPLASASMRFECARIAASKQTAKDLLEAIALVNGLPSDHAMRPEADRMIELWSQEVLKLADELFNAGKLDQAINAAQQIPSQVTAYRLVEKRINTWKQTWSEAEAIYQKAEAALRKRDWRKAFDQAVRLLDVNNKYWQTTRYDDLNNRINTARADGNKLFKAEGLADTGDLTNLKQAIKLAEEIRPDSYIYDLAQVKIQAFGRKMLDLAQKALDQRNLQEALSIISQIPENAKVEWEKRDLTVLANAQSSVWQNTVSGLEDAIAQAQRIPPGRPLYDKAQSWIARWQYEIEGLAQIERARLLAQAGNIEALQAAIASASLVGAANPRWQEAQTEIRKWTAQIQTITDRPFLDQAEQMASAGDINSLQAAINQANQIADGRSLYTEAQQKVRQWTRQIQQIQDQPYLDQARAYAAGGNLPTAIEVAQQIRSGRALYDQAQTEIARWRNQIQSQVEQAQAAQAQAQAQRNLQEARQMANTGNPTALANAIQLVSQVSTSGSVQADINAAINDWSWQLLQIAKDQANALNVAGAIATAQRIPPRATAYAEAQAQIQTWQSGKVLRR